MGKKRSRKAGQWEQFSVEIEEVEGREARDGERGQGKGVEERKLGS